MTKKTPTPKEASANKTTHSLSELAEKVSAEQARWLQVIADNPGIKTHELSRHRLLSNNCHQVSRQINMTIKPLGWQITKKPGAHRSDSWSWHLVDCDQNNGGCSDADLSH